jgi:hypothetical protein
MASQRRQRTRSPKNRAAMPVVKKGIVKLSATASTKVTLLIA